MCILRVPSVPTGLIVADFFVPCLGAFRRALLGGHYCKHEGQKEKRGPKRGQNVYVTPAFWGVPNAKHGEQNQK